MKNFTPVSEWLQIEHEDDPYFVFDNNRYSLSDFLRVHNNPWITGINYPEEIHAAGQAVDGTTIYLSIDSGERVKVFKEVK